MGTYNFKSVGKTQAQALVEKLESTKTPIGIKTPLQLSLGENTEIVVTYDNLADVTHDNLRNLIQTNWGERLGLYDLGANVRPLLSEYVSSDDFDGKAIDRISNAVNRWMPYVSLENYTSSLESSGGSATRVHLRITYSIPVLGITGRLLEVTLTVM
jgi:phage baseplate assembly protein W